MDILSTFRDNLRPQSPPETRLLTGWGRTAPSRSVVKRPSTSDEIRQLMRRSHRRGLIARGLGRSYGDPAQNAGGAVIDMTGFDHVHSIDLEHSTVTVGGGMSIHRMMELFVPLGLFVPVTPGTRYVTIGGAIACDIHGKNHHVDGAFGDHVRSFELMTADGEIRTVNPSSDSELFRATCGGMGLTGFILSATIEMIPIRTSRVLVDTDRADNLDDLLELMASGDDRYQYSVSWIDTLARGRSFGRGVLYRGNHMDEPDGEPRLARPRRSPLSIPDVIPAGLVGLTSARLFNEFWYRRHPESERDTPQELSAFFHQLDMVENTNRVYGSRGFVQHQCVIPHAEEGALRQILEILSDERVPTYLVVLKRMGQGNGLLSFPIEGWTLAADIPTAWEGLGELLDCIDDIVASANGRLYLAKDSRMRPEMIPAMYPELESWRAIVNKHDPSGRLKSDLSRRLDLRGQEGA